MNERMVCFFYLLMRNELPTGVVAELVQEIEKTEVGADFEFTNKHLAAMAEEYVKRIGDNMVTGISEILLNQLRFWIKEMPGVSLLQDMECPVDMNAGEALTARSMKINKEDFNAENFANYFLANGITKVALYMIIDYEEIYKSHCKPGVIVDTVTFEERPATELEILAAQINAKTYIIRAYFG
jgi:hypothetical protein